MKNYFFLFSVVLLIATNVYAQSDRTNSEFDVVRNELTQWDPIRGEWLASSFLAMSMNDPIPARTFPERITPAEMYRLVPLERQVIIQDFISKSMRNASISANTINWMNNLRFAALPTSQILTAGSVGDPHLISFDGQTTSFQAVGEFVLCKSEASKFEIQSRQERISNSNSPEVSFNTAVALNVSGDKVCIFANEKPDNTSNSSLRVNGEAVFLTNPIYYLPHGGIISYSNKSYTLSWPTGEKGIFEIHSTADMNYINITIQIYADPERDYDGLLGNANGSKEDDFGRNNMLLADSKHTNSNEADRKFLKYIVKEYGKTYRVTSESALFMYKNGENTYTFSDDKFPKTFQTIGDLPTDKRSASEKLCKEKGVTELYLNACIYDYAYLNIEPSASPTFIDPTRNMKLVQLNKPIVNTNETVGTIHSESKENEIPETKETITPRRSFPERVNRLFTLGSIFGSSGSTISFPSPTISFPSGTIIRP